MEQPKTISVEELKSLLLQRKTTTPRFKLPLRQPQAVNLLLAAYKAEVEARHRQFVGDEHTIGIIRRLATLLTSDSNSFGVVFCGLCGNGKSTMLHALESAIDYLKQTGDLSEDYSRLHVLPAKEIIEAAKKDPEYYKRIRRWLMLGIDDLGTEATDVLDYGNITSPIVDLLEYRYDNQLFTALSTNIPPKDIKAKYGTRVADRFKEMMEIFTFEHPSYRIINTQL